MSIENQQSFRRDNPKEEIPLTDPSLEEVREEPNPEKDKTPPLPPEKIQEIIDGISEEEDEEKKREEEVNKIIEKIRKEQ